MEIEGIRRNDGSEYRSRSLRSIQHQLRIDAELQQTLIQQGKAIVRSLFILIAFLYLFHPYTTNAAICTATLPPGVTTDAAFDQLLSTCAGKEIQFASGTYRFVPSGEQIGFYIPAGTTLTGKGNSSVVNPTIFEVASTGSYRSLLWARNASNITIQDIAFEGIDSTNNLSYSSGCPEKDFGRAIWIQSDAQTDPATLSSVENITIQNDSFRDFNGASWIRVAAADNSPGVGQSTEIAIRTNSFYTDSLINGGCSAKQVGGGYARYMIDLEGGTTQGSVNGFVRNVSVASNNPMNASYIEGAISVWSNVSNVSLQFNTIPGAGNQVAPVANPMSLELLQYAIVVYDAAHGQTSPPDSVWIVGNSIQNGVSAGIYTAGATNLAIYQNSISGQSDPFDTTLPKGAIALNASTTMPSRPMVDNNLAANYIGLSIVGGNISAGSNTITVPGGSFGMKLGSSNPGEAPSMLSIRGATLTTTATANATSIIGFGTNFASGFLGVTQSGWTTSGGSNRGLSWFPTFADSTSFSNAYTAFSSVPHFTFGDPVNPLTANGALQTSFWH